MRYFIGIDGGGTKTALCCINGRGELLATVNTGSSAYRQHGLDTVCETLRNGFDKLLGEAGITRGEVTGIAMGAPGYGESKKYAALLDEALIQLFAPLPLLLVNDAVVGWAGSLGLEDGINIVSGTGSIAFGRNSKGETARCGGWGEFFSDEGSCYWLGRKTMEVFSKESDGRLPRGPLYTIVREKFGLDSDYEFIEDVADKLCSSRKEVAALQTLLYHAATAGDGGALEAYRMAVDELTLIIKGVKDAILPEKTDCPVSYSGGLFHTGELVLSPFRTQLAQLGCVLRQPRFDPWVGAVLLAVERFGPEELPAVLAALPAAK